MDIKELREEINSINDQMTKLFEQRMQVASQIADYKKANKMMVMDSAREREIISTETEFGTGIFFDDFFSNFVVKRDQIL